MIRATLLSLAVVTAFAVLAGCPRPMPAPPQPIPIDPGLMACPDNTPAPIPEDVCEGMATPSGLQCVKCKVEVGCYLPTAVVYCTTQCYDPACTVGGRHRR